MNAFNRGLPVRSAGRIAKTPAASWQPHQRERHQQKQPDCFDPQASSHAMVDLAVEQKKASADGDDHGLIA